MADEEKKAKVVFTHPDGTVQESEIGHDDYVVLTGPGRHIAHEQHFPGKGTVILTIKRTESEGG